MKALLSLAPGGPETLVLSDRPTPEPAAGELVVSVLACGINFPDVLIIEDKCSCAPSALLRPVRKWPAWLRRWASVSMAGGRATG
jgi:NADPH:quinone reductase-like Zn-dependent oxidoreductase